MNPSQLKETTMHPNKRTLIKVSMHQDDNTHTFVERLMGKKAEERMLFIQENALNDIDLDI
jgi:topoisomerase IV subunit B